MGRQVDRDPANHCDPQLIDLFGAKDLVSDGRITWYGLKKKKHPFSHRPKVCLKDSGKFCKKQIFVEAFYPCDRFWVCLKKKTCFRRAKKKKKPKNCYITKLQRVGKLVGSRFSMTGSLGYDSHQRKAKEPLKNDSNNNINWLQLEVENKIALSALSFNTYCQVHH